MCYKRKGQIMRVSNVNCSTNRVTKTPHFTMALHMPPTAELEPKIGVYAAGEIERIRPVLEAAASRLHITGVPEKGKDITFDKLVLRIQNEKPGDIIWQQFENPVVEIAVHPHRGDMQTSFGDDVMMALQFAKDMLKTLSMR